MCIGMTTIMVGNPKSNSSTDVVKDDLEKNEQETQSPESTKPPVNTPQSLVRNDFSEDDGTLKRDSYPQINRLVEKYMKAITQSDINTLDKITDGITFQAEELQKRAEYIEGYENIECYTLQGKEAKSYIVFVYNETKFVDIETLVPGMIRLYIRTNEKGKLYIYFGEIDSDISAYIEEIQKEEEVKNLITTVNKKYAEAIAKDADLKRLLDNMNEDTTSEEEKVDSKKTTNKKKANQSNSKKTNNN